MTPGEWMLVNASLPLRDEKLLYTLTIRDGIWLAVEPQEGPVYIPDAVPIDGMQGDRPDERIVDLGGKVLLPGLVDAHMHLDKSFCLPQVGNASGTLAEAVNNYSAAVPGFSKEEIKARIVRSALQAVSFGTTAIRTHLDFHARWGAEVALRTVEAALEAKEELAPYLELELFPLAPYFRFADKETEVLEEAIRMGMTGIGSAPHLSPTPERDIDSLFRLAEKYDLPLDFHTDESDDPNKRTLEYIAKRTVERGWSGRVTVDHLCSLAAMNDMDAGKLIERMVESRLTAVTLPGANLYLQGRHDGFPVRRGVTRVKELLAAGIPLASASDNIHDPFHPFGRGDLIQIGLITAYAAHMGSSADIRTILRMITEIPAAILGLEGYGILAGNKADFVVLDGMTPEELFTMLPERRWIYRRGGWLRLAAGRAGWNEPRLERYWNEAAQRLPFGQFRAGRA
ncbi:amidohydrolase family protein [Cohnella suwonensis]|uniref:Amidohydrolase family protein n=1 Tax=Cohnella suwonensis TaxID=696072 RepID=A0ABW0LQD1_9BACL